jgi:hypothetical protein
VRKRSGRAQTAGWLTLFLLFPLGVWYLATGSAGFAGKTVTNLSLEPALVALASVVVFVLWYLGSREGLRPAPGLVLLLLLAAAAWALHRLLPALRE